MKVAICTQMEQVVEVTLELYGDFLIKTEASRCNDKVVDDISEAEMSSFSRFTVQEII